MKVLHFLDANAHAGGVATHVKALAALLRANHYQPVVVGLTYPGPSARLDWADDHFPLTYGIWQGLRQRRKLTALLHAIKPDLIHVHSGFTTVSPVLLKDMNQSWPVVGTLHDVRPFCFHATRRLMPDDQSCEYRCGIRCVTRGCFPIRSALDIPKRLRSSTINELTLAQWRKMRRVIVPSGFMRELALQHAFDAKKVITVPHFSEVPSRLPVTVEKSPPLILYLGRMDEKKGPSYLLEALAMLRHQPWQAVFAGEGPALQELQKKALELRISDRVIFPGAVTLREKSDWLASTAMLIFPSIIPESFGLSGIEAMAFGKPVVSFGLGGVREWLEHEHNGLIAKDRDVQALARHIQTLLEDPEYRRRLGHNARVTAMNKFLASRYLDAINHIYHKLD